MIEKPINLAKLLEWDIYKDSNGNHIIKIPIKGKDILLKERKYDQWLLISNQRPQAILQTNEAFQFLKEIKKSMLLAGGNERASFRSK